MRYLRYRREEDIEILYSKERTKKGNQIICQITITERDQDIIIIIAIIATNSCFCF
jgi:hypothetical protein